MRPSGESGFNDVDRIQLEQAREMSAMDTSRLAALPDVETCIGCQRELEDLARHVDESREAVRAA